MARATGDPGTNGPRGPDWGATWADAIDGLTRALQLGADLQRRMTGSTLSGLDVGTDAFRGAQEGWRRYAMQVTELTVDYYRAVAEAARDYGEELTSSDRTTRQDHDHTHTTSGSQGGSRRTTQAVREEPDGPAIELRGPIGSVLATSLVIENRDPDPAEVTVTADLARGPDGERFVAPLSVDPAALTIPAGGTAEVGLRVPLLAEVFATGARYRLPLRVDGPRPTTIEVAIVADEAASGGAAERETPVPDVARDDGSSAVQGPPGDDGSSARAVPAADEPVGYRVRCPACERTFERTTADLRLRPHKTPDGEACPERDGRRVRR